MDKELICQIRRRIYDLYFLNFEDFMAVNMQTTVFQKVIPRSLADSTNVLKEPSASNVQGTTSLLTWRWQ